MEQFLPLIVIIAIAIGGGLLKKYLEKQQLEQEATRREGLREAQRKAPRRHQLGELKDQLEALAQADRPEDEETPASRPQPAMPSRQRHATQRPAAAPPAAREAVRPGDADLAAPTKPAPKPPAGQVPRRGVGYLGGMLRGRNLARAVVLSEILGPPEALHDK
ncbi:MAG: hypothetical protein ISS74_06010 [Planctomycetes bacterium]|nr:hypothetical protein [Planctomycetota bacterium]